MPRDIQLPDGRTLKIPDNATYSQLMALRLKLRTAYPYGNMPTPKILSATGTTGPGKDPLLVHLLQGLPDPEPTDNLTDKGHPVLSVLAQMGMAETGLPEAIAKTNFAGKHPIIDALGEALSNLPFSAELPEELASRGIPVTLKASLPSMAKRAAVGAGTGGVLGSTFGGKKGAAIGALTGALTGGVSGYGNVPLTVEQEAEKAVEMELAKKAARVRMGIDPPSEDTMAEVLRQEFLEPPKKSGIPQDIPIPKAKTPTYVPKGVPGFEEVTPEVSKLAEGPTALQHQVAREQALDDIRNATINRPGWVAKLKAQMPALKKMSPQAQRQVITKAITDDPVASAAVRDGARLGSAGDLASWKPEDLWTQYMTEYSKGAKANKQWMKVLQDEVARRGLVRALPGQVRP